MSAICGETLKGGRQACSAGEAAGQVAQGLSKDSVFKEELSSGFVVAGVPLPRAAFVHLLLVVRAGSTFELDHEEGYTELLASLLCRGAGPWDRQQFALECDSRGASLQVLGSRDLFVFELSLLPEDLVWGLELLARVFYEPRLEPQEIAVALKEQQQQNLARCNEQRTALGDLARANLFTPTHAYSRPLGGRPQIELKATAAELRLFHSRLILGEQPLALCAVGAFDPQVLLNQLRRFFVGGSDAARLAHMPPQAQAGIYAVHPTPFFELEFLTEQSRILLGLPAPSRGHPQHLEAYLANEIFGGAFLSRLTRAVRAKEGLAYSASSTLWSGFQGGALWISLQTDQANLPKALRTVRVTIDDLLGKGLEAEEVEQFRLFAENSLTFEYDSLSGLASRLLEYILFAEPWQLAERQREIRQRAKPEVLQHALKDMLKVEAAVLCLSGRPNRPQTAKAFFAASSGQQRRKLGVDQLQAPAKLAFSYAKPVEPSLLATNQTAQLFGYPNGLHLLCLPRPEVPSISLQVWTLTGLLDEVPGSTGLSHLLEHLMFRGTKAVPDGEFDAVLAQKGGVNNAFTSEDFTVYTDYVTSEGLLDALTLEADRFTQLEVSSQHFATEREVVLEERSLRVDASPLGKLFEQLQSAAMPSHPYGWPVIGWREDVSSLTLDKVMRHYRLACQTSRLLVVVAGGCAPQQAARLVGQTLGTWLPPPAIETVATAAGGQVERASWPVLASADPVPLLKPDFLVLKERSGYSYLLATFRFPREGHPDYEAAELLSRILGEGDSSLLHDRYVRQQQWAVETWISYEPQAREHPLLHLGLATTEDFDSEERRQELGDFLKAVPELLSEQQLEKARRGWRAEAAYSTDDLEEWAVEIAARVMVLDWESVWTVGERIERIRLEQLREVARCYLAPEVAVMAHLQALR